MSVKDTGIGISPKDQEKIFRRFVQIDGSLSRQHEGTGLGLPMAREFVELHSGYITVASTPHEGSVFTIQLPLLEEEPNL